MSQLATDYDKTKDELNSSKEQRNELVQLARTQADKIAQLEDENLYQNSSTVVTANLKSDLMRDLDDKYRQLQVRYNKLGKRNPIAYSNSCLKRNDTDLMSPVVFNTFFVASQVDKKDKKMARVTPEYNDIFRRMFEVLSDSIDRHHPTDVPKSTRTHNRQHKNEQIVYEPSTRKS